LFEAFEIIRRGFQVVSKGHTSGFPGLSFSEIVRNWEDLNCKKFQSRSPSVCSFSEMAYMEKPDFELTIEEDFQESSHIIVTPSIDDFSSKLNEECSQFSQLSCISEEDQINPTSFHSISEPVNLERFVSFDSFEDHDDTSPETHAEDEVSNDAYFSFNRRGENIPHKVSKTKTSPLSEDEIE